MKNVTFRLTGKDGKESFLMTSNLIAIPSTGDIIKDPIVGNKFYTYKVESVVHEDVFTSPAEHKITVNLKQL